MNNIDPFWTYVGANPHVQISVNVIKDAFSKYPPENTAISFNGGKDCTVVLYLINKIVESSLIDNTDSSIHMPRVFYAPLPDYFQEEYDFVTQTAINLNLTILQYTKDTLKKSLQQLSSEHPDLKAIFIGTRNDDHKLDRKLNVFAETDEDWPRFMRINPIINWTYKQVWDFIRTLSIPFCDLYKQGYSSLGARSNTTKNEKLFKIDSHGQGYYLPAWCLDNSSDERLSRLSSSDEKSNGL